MRHKQKIQIYFENSQDKLPVTYALKMLIRRAVTETLAYEQYRNDVEVSVTFTDNEGIRALNQKFRGIDKETDVLSFPLFDYDGNEKEPPIDELENALGDIVLSLEKAKAQAEEFGHGVKREYAFLIAHSMLHLLGYDHMTPEEAAVMEAKQNQVLNELKITRGDANEN